MRYEFSWEVIASSAPLLLVGVVATLELAGSSVAIGLPIGILGAAARVSRVRALRRIVGAYVEVIRNTPMLVQLYFIFYGLPRLGVRFDSDLTALLALSLYCGAYVVEIVRAGIEAVDRGQIEAARALGLGEASVFGRVVLPQAMRTALPAIGGQVIVMLKLSSLASVIGAEELTYVVVDVVAQTYRSFELYAMAGLVYLGLTLGVAALFRAVEARLRVPH
ncbi:MAG: amino acid ABC transporter permease [Candidatus Rokuibacteriota bacterium]